MIVDHKSNKVALTAEADANAACRERVKDYLARTGLSAGDFAQRIGYGKSSVQLFLGNSYHHVAGTAVHLVKAASEFMDAHPIGDSGRVMGELYDTANVRAIRETFNGLLARPVAYMIYAPPGSQKSFVLEHQVAGLNRQSLADSSFGACRAYYVYARENIRPRDLVRRVSIACGSRTGSEIDSMLQNLRFQFRDKRVVLVVDEAQHLSIDCYETLRELLDQPPYFSLLFAGSHDLKIKFDQFSATLEQWNSRIIAKVRLPGLQRDEAEGIIRRELKGPLDSWSPAKLAKAIDGLIADATVNDRFERNRTYINVRSLTNSLCAIKSRAAKGAVR